MSRGSRVLRCHPFYRTIPRRVKSDRLLGPTVPAYTGFNPAWGQVNAEQLWGQAHADVIKNSMRPSEAVDKAFKRMQAIFSKFTFD
jgi:ABC-type glycerol-3-phosphate transport system substrate-binding protein